MLFISPPFGNYIGLPKTTRIYGSFTLKPRDGLLYHVITTLRYIPKYRGWVNKIGLRNKGIDWALKNVPENHIISVAIMNAEEIEPLIEKIPYDRNIELNVSCPNVQKSGNIGGRLKGFLSPKRQWCIVKVSPYTNTQQLDEYYTQGFRQFHCCNTIPISEGGLSGLAIQPYTQKWIQYLKSTYKDVECIAGGGIVHIDHIQLYRHIGADHFAISTGWFQPWYSLWVWFYLYQRTFEI